MAAMVLVQWLASRAWAGTVRVPWIVGADPHEGGLFGAALGLRPVVLGPWVWAAVGLALIGAILAAIGALHLPDVGGRHLDERHCLTLALVLAVAEFGALSTLAGWQPWALTAAPVAAIWWAFHSPCGPQSKVRARLIQRRLVRRWDRRIVRASEGRLRCRRVTVGDALTLLVCSLVDVPQSAVAKNLGTLATRLGLAASQLTVDPSTDAAQVTLRITHSDPLATPVESTVTTIEAPADTPVRVGRDALGTPATIDLLGGHHLIAGRTGAGKSRALMLWLIGAAQRGASLHVVDLKWGVDVQPIRARCETVATTLNDARTVIGGVRAEMERRGRKMEAEGWSDWAQSADPAPMVLGIDEAASLVAERDAWGDLLEIVRKGRAAWVVVVMATQRPTGDTLPTAVTGQLGTRWLGPLTPAESEVAMAGAVSPLAPHQLAERPGRAVLVRGGRGVEIQTDRLSDEAVAAWARAVPTVATEDGTQLTDLQAAVLAVVQASPGLTAEQIGAQLEPPRSRQQMTRTLKGRGLSGLVEQIPDTRPVAWRATNKESNQ
ncbi:MAG: FtsK/SpoIIIE domain-containing protein [Microthrixaceae bacterium]